MRAIKAFILCLMIGATVAACGEDQEGDPNAADSSSSDSAMVSGSTGIDSADDGEEIESPEDARYDLSMKANVGDTYSYRLERSTHVARGELTQTQKQVFDLTLDVVAVNDDGSAILGVTFDRIRVDASARVPQVDSTGRPQLDSAGNPVMETQSASSDTRSSKNSPVAQQHKDYIGRRMLATVDKRFEVRDVTNVEPILNATLKRMKVSADTADPDAIRMVRQRIQLDVYMALSGVFFSLLPDTAVAVSGKWSVIDSVQGAGAGSQAEISLRLKSIKESDGRKRALVTASVNKNVAVPNETFEQGPISIKIDKSTISGNGESLLDIATGFPVRRHAVISSDLTGTQSVTKGESKGKSATVTVSQRLNRDVRLKKYTPAE